MVRIIEKQIIGKRSQETCEDGIVITDDFLAVIDGSTSKADICYSDEVSNGRLCMLIVSDVIRGLNADAAMYDFCRKATDAVCAYYEGKPLSPSNNLMASSAVVYSIARKEIWFVGDCQALVDGVLYEYPKPEESIMAEKRSSFLRKMFADCTVSIDECCMKDPGRAVIIDDLKRSCTRQNIEYAVINGMDIPHRLIHSMQVQDGSEVVLASDGYPFLCKTLEESEHRLAEVLDKDPLCINLYKATKGVVKGNQSFDDRTYLRLKV